MDQQIIELYDKYTHSLLSRKDFFKRLALLTGSTAAALALMPMLKNNYANAAVTKSDDLFTEYVNYPGVPGEMKAYVARPKEDKKYPAIVVIHENRGLNAHIEDVARRVANAGYLAIAPNALSALGRTFADEDESRKAFSELKAADNLTNFINVFDYLSTRKDFNGHAGCVGFCWGGAMANNLAVHVPSLKAAVAFYGSQPKSADDVAKINAAVQTHNAGLDERINAGIAAYEEALKNNNIRFESYLYPNVNHAFHNDISPTRYDEASAKLAWQRTLDFFKKYVN